MKLRALVITIAALGFLAGCGHDEMVRRDTVTTTKIQPPPIVEQHTTTELVPKD